MKVFKVSESGYRTFQTHDYIPFLEVQHLFKEGDPVVVTEKIRSNQISIGRTAAGRITVTSKHLAKQGLLLTEFLPETVMESFTRWSRNRPRKRNHLWQAALNSNIVQMLQNWPLSTEIQVWGLLVPSLAPGSAYGKDITVSPTLLVERVSIDGKDAGHNTYFARWVPLLHWGSFDPESTLSLTVGTEQVSGLKLHQRAGVVIRHQRLQFLRDGRALIASADPHTFEEWSQKHAQETA